MVQSLIELSEDTNRVLNVIKAKHGLRTKSEAIELVTQAYAEELMEPELRPAYAKKLEKIDGERSVPVRNFGKRYGLR
ncbi:MAG: DUF2683 domain-containing protein [Methanobacteriota archaeon]|nr:MAG: DUF2683 domain-containing protein [Euryarchaeota archaeon]